eukprot:scaffold223_cov408-Prasinococcus_capsulatus_cf.AAC.9
MTRPSRPPACVQRLPTDALCVRKPALQVDLKYSPGCGPAAAAAAALGPEMFPFRCAACSGRRLRRPPRPRRRGKTWNTAGPLHGKVSPPSWRAPPPTPRERRGTEALKTHANPKYP